MAGVSSTFMYQEALVSGKPAGKVTDPSHTHTLSTEADLVAFSLSMQHSSVAICIKQYSTYRCVSKERTQNVNEKM